MPDRLKPTQNLTSLADLPLNSNRPMISPLLRRRTWLAGAITIQEAHTVVLDPQNLSVIVARIGPAQWGAVAQSMAQ